MAGFAPGELQMALLREVHARGSAATVNLAEALDVPPKRVSKAASSLIARGYLTRNRIGLYGISLRGAEAVRTGIVITSGPVDPDATVLARTITHGFRDRVWRSMRVRGSFTILDLVTDARRDEADAVNDTSRYIRILKAAGYLSDLPGRVPGTRPGSNGYKRFRLIRNSGPRAPLHRSRLGIVHDFNTGEDVPCIRI